MLASKAEGCHLFYLFTKFLNISLIMQENNSISKIFVTTRKIQKNIISVAIYVIF